MFDFSLFMNIVELVYALKDPRVLFISLVIYIFVQFVGTII